MHHENCSSIPINLLQQLLAEADISRTLEILTRYVEETLPQFRTMILLHDVDKNSLYMGSSPSLPCITEDASILIEENGTASSQAAFYKKPILCQDLAALKSGRPYLNYIEQYNVRSSYAFPILSTKNELLGVFTFLSSKPFSKDDEESTFFQALTSLAAVVLERYWNQRRTKTILAELQSSQERLNLALQSQRMGVWDWYIQADRLIWDDTMFELYGLSRTEVQGNLSDMKKRMHPEDIEAMIKALRQVFEKNINFEHEFRIIRNGEIRHVAAIGYVVRDESGEPIRMTGLNWDITEKVISNKKLDQERAKAVANSKMASLGEMASGIAHEINNPLTIILNRANQLKSRLQNGKFEKEWAQQELVKIENTVERIAKIIRGLRAFSRNADSDPMIVCELNSIVDETLELCREKFKRYGINFMLKGFHTILAVKCRPSQISQVLLNLFNNSFDAIVNTQNPWIELEVSVSQGRVCLKVTDSGHGIPSHIADRMMDPFFSTKEVGRGTGLGLSISRGIIEEHEGRLTLDRDHPHTRFVIELPLEEILKPIIGSTVSIEYQQSQQQVQH